MTVVSAGMDPQWSGLDAIYGGYVVARVMEAMSCVDGLEVLSATVGFLGRVRPGEVQLDVDVVHAGSRTATVRSTLSQGHPRVVGLSKLGVRRDGDRTGRVDVSGLETPDHLGRPVAPWGAVSFDGRVDVRWLAAPDGDPSSSARAWVRISSSPDDVPALRGAMLAPMFLDVLPPGTWYVDELAGFAPTIELTVHLGPRQAEYDRWHLVEQRSVIRADDYWVEDAVLYDDEGRLVAVARQTRRVTPQEGSP